MNFASSISYNQLKLCRSSFHMTFKSYPQHRKEKKTY